MGILRFFLPNISQKKNGQRASYVSDRTAHHVECDLFQRRLNKAKKRLEHESGVFVYKNQYAMYIC